MNMNIPENGRVVVIDDNPEEAIPLISVLSKNCVPVTYFTGNLEELPENGLNSVRFVFLDLRLVKSTNEKVVISSLVGVLSKILKEDNGPYFIVLWSKHEDEYKSAFENAFNVDATLKKIKPLVIISIEKDTYIESINDDIKFKSDAILNIESKLKEKLDELGIFHLFTIWENLVHNAAGKTINDFSEFYTFDKNWNKNIETLFFKLAKGVLDEQLDISDTENIIKTSLFSFNGVFLDGVESETRNCDLSDVELSFKDTQNNVSKEITGRINSKLLLTMDIGNTIFPGNVYDDSIDAKKVDIEGLFNGKLEDYEQKDNLTSDIRHIYLEITPPCDYTNKKWRVSRLLPGVLWPESHGNRIKRNADFIYCSPLIVFENNLYYMVFDHRFYTSIEFSALNEKTPLFRARHQLLVDIQSKLSSQMNRPGVISVK